VGRRPHPPQHRRCSRRLLQPGAQLVQILLAHIDCRDPPRGSNGSSNAERVKPFAGDDVCDSLAGLGLQGSQNLANLFELLAMSLPPCASAGLGMDSSNSNNIALQRRQ
jgi:hypothetical protein